METCLARQVDGAVVDHHLAQTVASVKALDGRHGGNDGLTSDHDHGATHADRDGVERRSADAGESGTGNAHSEHLASYVRVSARYYEPSMDGGLFMKCSLAHAYVRGQTGLNHAIMHAAHQALAMQYVKCRQSLEGLVQVFRIDVGLGKSIIPLPRCPATVDDCLRADPASCTAVRRRLLVPFGMNGSRRNSTVAMRL